MENIKITCDSTCDLTAELYQQHSVEVIPLGITLGEEFRRDGVDVTAEDVFAYVQAGGELPKTAAISVGEYAEIFRRHTAQGCKVIHISVASTLSSSHNNARLAAEDVGNVFVVDSRNLSSASGLLVLQAAELRDAGFSAEEIVIRLNEKKELLDASFVLQTLDFLHKGGRCSGVAVFGANALKLRPEIVVTEGTLHVGKKYRGQLEKSVLSFVRGRLEGATDIDTSRAILVHSGVPREVLDQVIALMKELQPFAEIIETKAGCTISSHCGPECLGLMLMRK